MKNSIMPENIRYSAKVLSTVFILVAALPVGLLCLVLSQMTSATSEIILSILLMLLLPSLIPFIWLKKKKAYAICWAIIVFATAGVCITYYSIEQYEESITINVTPNINVNEYLPFDEDSKIVKFDSNTLKLTDDLPIIDGAAASFPVYSAFVNAVYPNTSRLYDGVFEYNNTVEGYKKLAERKTDIFIGAQPSKEQINYAKGQGTVFKYTQIGSEAFVFFVHKDNPVSNLTAEQIRKIYSGEITNWKDVGGNDEEIAAYQRNTGSGSQSMMLRFMGDTPIMDAETKVIRGMGEMIEMVADYQSRSGSIGFSFRYYVEGIINNPDIKMISVDGVAPTAENIKSSSYPIIAPVYAVTYEGNPNSNVDALLNWMLSDEGQYIIEETGYVGIGR